MFALSFLSYLKSDEIKFLQEMVNVHTYKYIVKASATCMFWENGRDD